MENIIAEWRVPGFYKANPQKVYEELKEIGEEYEAEDIVEAAKDEESELHKCFEWDDNEAAFKYRLHQARVLTSQLVFKRETAEDGTKTPAVRILNKTNDGGYKVPERVFKVQSEYEALLQKAWAELRQFKAKYSALQELNYILRLID